MTRPAAPAAPVFRNLRRSEFVVGILNPHLPQFLGFLGEESILCGASGAGIFGCRFRGAGVSPAVLVDAWPKTRRRDAGATKDRRPDLKLISVEGTLGLL